MFLYFILFSIFIEFINCQGQCPDGGQLNTTTIKSFPCKCFYGYRQDINEWSNVVRIDCTNVTVADVRSGFRSVSSSLNDHDVITVRHFYADPILVSTDVSNSSKTSTHLPPLLFGKFRFSSITIKNSNLSSFDPMIFTKLLISDQSTIDLSGNNLTSGDPVNQLLAKFSGSNISINLSGNKLTELNPTIKLSLKQLNLSNNLITTIKEQQLSIDNSFIDLSYNKINSIESNSITLNGNSNSVVNLSHNQLDEYSISLNFIADGHNQINSVGSSVTINLNHNKIKFLHPTIYKSMTSPSNNFNKFKVTTDGNPIKCDCKMSWARFKIPTIKCINDGRFLGQYKDSDFKHCHDGSSFPMESCSRIFHPCQCNGTTIDCSGVFYKVIKTIFEPLAKLYSSPLNVFDTFIADPIMFPTATGHGGHQLDIGLFDFINFDTIIIKNSDISFVDPRTFFATKTKVLDLSGNQLNESIFDALIQFPMAEKLILSRNNITTVPSFAFKNNLEISAIDLSRNQIKIVKSNAFYFNPPTESINYLDINLSINNLTDKSLDQWSFNLTNRYKVSTFLNDNLLTKIDEQVFGLADNLTNGQHYIYLNGNPIEKSTMNRLILRKHLINYTGFPKEKFCFAKPDCTTNNLLIAL